MNNSTNNQFAGLARGEFEILSGMPNEYAQGIYAKPGRHGAMVRFSNGTNHVGGDRFLGPIVGIGLKILGIEGPTLLEDDRTRKLKYLHSQKKNSNVRLYK